LYSIYSPIPALADISLKERFESDKQKYEFIIEESIFGEQYSYICFKAINGIKTSDFYYVTYDNNGEITKIKHSPFWVGNQKFLPVNIKETAHIAESSLIFHG
jgi:hypothetical protein